MFGAPSTRAATERAVGAGGQGQRPFLCFLPRKRGVGSGAGNMTDCLLSLSFSRAVRQTTPRAARPNLFWISSRTFMGSHLERLDISPLSARHCRRCKGGDGLERAQRPREFFFSPAPARCQRTGGGEGGGDPKRSTFARVETSQGKMEGRVLPVGRVLSRCATQMTRPARNGRLIGSAFSIAYCVFILARVFYVEPDLSFSVTGFAASALTTAIAEAILYAALRPAFGKHAAMLVSIAPSVLCTALALAGWVALAAAVALGHHLVFMLEEIFVSGLTWIMFVHHLSLALAVWGARCSGHSAAPARTGRAVRPDLSSCSWRRRTLTTFWRPSSAIGSSPGGRQISCRRTAC